MIQDNQHDYIYETVFEKSKLFIIAVGNCASERLDVIYKKLEAYERAEAFEFLVIHVDDKPFEHEPNLVQGLDSVNHRLYYPTKLTLIISTQTIAPTQTNQR